MNLRQQLTDSVGKGHLSYSSIKYALGDMRLWEMYMRGQLKKQSEALTFGTLYDMLLFERDKAIETYMVIDSDQILASCSQKTQDSKRPAMTAEYKSIKADMQEEAKASGKELCSEDDWNQANDMIDRLDACGLLNTYLNGQYQVEFNKDIDGVPLKGFLDCLGDGFITDSKSARSVNKFKYDVNSWSYDIQAYIYSTVFGIDNYYWVVQEKAYPYYPALVKCTEETMLRGEMKFHEALTNIKEWLANGHKTETHYAVFDV
tara:strand:- start:3224 stop:4006 length:783 start_codon:yes stop_codon:yes gene_type:complete